VYDFVRESTLFCNELISFSFFLSLLNRAKAALTIARTADMQENNLIPQERKEAAIPEKRNRPLVAFRRSTTGRTTRRYHRILIISFLYKLKSPDIRAF